MEGQRGGGVATCGVLPLFRSAFATWRWVDPRNARPRSSVMGWDTQGKMGFETNFPDISLSR